MADTNQTLAQLVRAKYPGAYDDLSDQQLEAAVLAKHPEYADLPRTGAAPSGTSSAPSAAEAIGLASQLGTAAPLVGRAASAILDNPVASGVLGIARELPVVKAFVPSTATVRTIAGILGGEDAATTQAAIKAANVVNYAKAAGTRLSPSDVIAGTDNPALDNYAASQGSRILRLFGPSGEQIAGAGVQAATSPGLVQSAISTVAPWLRVLGNAAGMMGAEADTLSRLNSPAAVAEVSKMLSPDQRAKLLEQYASQPEYVRAIEAANQPALMRLATGR